MSKVNYLPGCDYDINVVCYHVLWCCFKYVHKLGIIFFYNLRETLLIYCKNVPVSIEDMPGIHISMREVIVALQVTLICVVVSILSAKLFE